MITSLVLSLREGLEAALIIGIVLGALRRTGRSDLNWSLWAGVVSAFIVSLLVALLLRLVDQELTGTTEQIFEGVTLLLAAGVLTWMIFWMRRQSGNIKSELEGKVSRAELGRGGGALFLLAFIAVLREGVELALYLTASSLASSAFQTLLGTSIGLLSAGVLGYLLYTSTLRLNLQRFFQVTSVILILFAAGLIAHSVAEFNEAGIIPAVISPIWNLNPLLNDQSVLGVIFSTLFGYHSRPSLTEVLSYGVYILAALLFFIRPRNLQAT
jgi:high-affinity iron transporter